MPKGYPPTHRNRKDPQPEVCDVCGLLIGGAHLRTEFIEGLEGRQVCPNHKWRHRLTYQDISQAHPGVPIMKIGHSRVYEPGSEIWWYTQEGNG